MGLCHIHFRFISDPKASVKETVEISEELPVGAKDTMKKGFGECAEPWPEERGLGIRALMETGQWQ